MLWRAWNLESLKLHTWLGALGKGKKEREKKKEKERLKKRKEKTFVLSLILQVWDSDSFIIFDLACIITSNLEIIVNSKKSQDIYYIVSSISGVYYNLVPLLMMCFKVSFLHENRAVLFEHFSHLLNCLGLWTIRNFLTPAVTYCFWSRNNQLRIFNYLIYGLNILLCITIKNMYQIFLYPM